MERLVSFQRAGSRDPRRRARAGRTRRACLRTSTISRTCCRSAASSTPSSAARTWCRIACIAQLVNVIAPIMTEPGGAAWRQTIYYPYYFASVYGRGVALRLAVNSPGYDADVADNVPYLDIAGVHDEEAGTLTVLRRQPPRRRDAGRRRSLCRDSATRADRPPGDDPRQSRRGEHARRTCTRSGRAKGPGAVRRRRRAAARNCRPTPIRCTDSA